MDNAAIEAEAREYLEHIVRRSHRDRQSIPTRAFERAIKTAAASARELHAAVRLAQKSQKEEGKRRAEQKRTARKTVAG